MPPAHLLHDAHADPAQPRAVGGVVALEGHAALLLRLDDDVADPVAGRHGARGERDLAVRDFHGHRDLLARPGGHDPEPQRPPLDLTAGHGDGAGGGAEASGDAVVPVGDVEGPGGGGLRLDEVVHGAEVHGVRHLAAAPAVRVRALGAVDGARIRHPAVGGDGGAKVDLRCWECSDRKGGGGWSGELHTWPLHRSDGATTRQSRCCEWGFWHDAMV